MASDTKKIQRDVEKYIERMPSLSTTVAKVLDICNRADPSPNELNKVISLDPVLTGQVLKLINSSYYSLVTRVTSLTRAITMLGVNTVKNMALSTAIIRSVGGSRRARALAAKKYWMHSIGVGACAKQLAAIKEVPVGEREEYFVAGLLHDLGKIPFGDEYVKILEKAREEMCPLIGLERELLGLDHQEIGLLIAKKWNFAPNIRACIEFHHDIDQADRAFQSQVAIVALADIYINILDVGYAGNPYPDVSYVEQLLEFAGLTWKEYGSVRQGVEKEIARARVFLRV